MINPNHNMITSILTNDYKYFAYQEQINVWIESNYSLRCHAATLFWPSPCMHTTMLHQAGVICQVMISFDQERV